MRVLYCTFALFNSAGMERVLTEKANYLANLPDYEIIILTTDHPKDKPVYFELDKRIKVIHLDLDYVSHFNASLLKKYLLHQKKQRIYKRKLREIIKYHDVDICISLCGKEIDFLYKLDVDCVKVAEFHFSMNIRKQIIASKSTSLLWRILGEIRTKQFIKTIKSLDKFIVLTQQDKKQWKQYVSNVQIISNPLTISLTDSFPKRKMEVIAVGRLEYQKGFDMLIESWSLVAEKHPDWQLSIFGKGEEKEKLEQQINYLQLEKSIFLKGVSSDIRSKYLESAFFVMSSRFEGLPLTLIEAMSCGLPCVAFDCEHGPRELITDNENGFLVEPNNIEDLAEKICLLIDHAKLREQMGKKGIEKSKEFSKEKIMGQWISLFEELVKAK